MKLVADRLSSSRGGRALFADLSFAVPEKGALLVTGPNGAGKTTLIRTIAGFLQPDAGAVRLEGASLDHALGELCHYLGHANAIKAALTVGENASFWSRFMGGARERLDVALQAFGLASLRDIPAGYLSAGQKRRLGLARLLLAERPLWLLDEPTTSLDSAGQNALAQVVNRHLAAGGLVMAATHLSLGFTGAQELRLGPGTATA